MVRIKNTFIIFITAFATMLTAGPLVLSIEGINQAVFAEKHSKDVINEQNHYRVDKDVNTQGQLKSQGNLPVSIGNITAFEKNLDLHLNSELSSIIK